MRDEGALLWLAERVRLTLLLVGIGAAGIVVVGGLAGKSGAWTGFADGGGQGWTDGVKPWAVWAILGGLVVIALLLVGSARGDGLWLAAVAGAFLLRHAANEAAEYRARIESGLLTMYDHHTLSLGLRVVPVVGTIGAIVVASLAAVNLGMTAGRRFAVGQRS